jgi:transposase
LTTTQQAQVRAFALRARADSPHRGHGTRLGAVGRNATEVIADWIEETFGVAYSIRGTIALLNRLGFEYADRAQGGFWCEAG